MGKGMEAGFIWWFLGLRYSTLYSPHAPLDWVSSVSVMTVMRKLRYYLVMTEFPLHVSISSQLQFPCASVPCPNLAPNHHMNPASISRLMFFSIRFSTIRMNIPVEALYHMPLERDPGLPFHVLYKP